LKLWKINVFDKNINHGSGRLVGIEIHPTTNYTATTGKKLVGHDNFFHTNAQVVAETAAK
jgi:hypothetical protein